MKNMFSKKNVKTRMESEIAEQTGIIPYVLMKYINPETGEIKIELPDNIRKIVLVASGSSYHCARFAVDLLEKFSKIESRAIYSSEFLLKSTVPHDNDILYVFITQSGETSDTNSALRKAKELNSPVLRTEARSWLNDTLLSVAVLASFSVIALLKHMGLQTAMYYIDPIVTLLFVIFL